MNLSGVFPSFTGIERSPGPLKKKTAEDGEQVRFECYVQAVPAPVIIWQKDGRDINFHTQPTR